MLSYLYQRAASTVFVSKFCLSLDHPHIPTEFMMITAEKLVGCGVWCEHECGVRDKIFRLSSQAQINLRLTNQPIFFSLFYSSNPVQYAAPVPSYGL